LRREKGQLVLLEAVRQLAQTRPVRLVVVGDGPDKELLRRTAEAGGIQAHFPGHDDDVWQWYAMADVVAVPSLAEGFGLTAVEALAAARPLVATDAGALPEILEHGRTALLVPAGDECALAAALDRLLTETALARELATAGRAEYERHYTIEAMTRRWLALYTHVLGER
jgi:glycosyltransferase involved in cell wall biosynthesis